MSSIASILKVIQSINQYQNPMNIELITQIFLKMLNQSSSINVKYKPLLAFTSELQRNIKNY